MEKVLCPHDEPLINDKRGHLLACGSRKSKEEKKGKQYSLVAIYMLQILRVGPNCGYHYICIVFESNECISTIPNKAIRQDEPFNLDIGGE